MNVAHEWRDAPPAEFAVVGDPVSHSWSPRMQMAALRALGRQERYVAVRVPIGEFDGALERLRTLGYLGVNVTVPLKEEAARWATAPDDLVVRLRAANTLRLADGSATNTDVGGILDSCNSAGIRPPAQALVLGAGGTARAALVALASAGFGIRVYNRTPARAEAMVRELGVPADVVERPDPRGVALILNATSASLSGGRLPIDWSLAEPGAVSIDAMYGLKASPFVEEALRAGLRAYDGRELLVAQGARSLEWWLGVDAPRATMREALG